MIHFALSTEAYNAINHWLVVSPSRLCFLEITSIFGGYFRPFSKHSLVINHFLPATQRSSGAS